MLMVFYNIQYKIQIHAKIVGILKAITTITVNGDKYHIAWL